MAKGKNNDDIKAADVSVKIKVLRAEYGMTQVQVAFKLGISQQMYSKYEKAETPIDSNMIKKLCELYGVSADYLLGIQTPNTGVKAEQTAFIASEEQLDALADILIKKINNKQK